jgi:hypothetical protein
MVAPKCWLAKASELFLNFRSSPILRSRQYFAGIYSVRMENAAWMIMMATAEQTFDT